MNHLITTPDDLVTLVEHPQTAFNLLVELGSMTICDEHGSFTLTYEEPAPQYEMIDAIVDGHEMEESEAIQWANGVCSDWETSKVDKLPTYNRHLDTVNGIDVYYDYGADYYFYVINED